MLHLAQVFATEPATYISITAHGGAIKAFLRACGHPNPDLHVGTGSMVPVVVKAVKCVLRESSTLVDKLMLFRLAQQYSGNE